MGGSAPAAAAGRGYARVDRPGSGRRGFGRRARLVVGRVRAGEGWRELDSSSGRGRCAARIASAATHGSAAGGAGDRVPSDRGGEGPERWGAPRGGEDGDDGDGARARGRGTRGDAVRGVRGWSIARVGDGGSRRPTGRTDPRARKARARSRDFSDAAKSHAKSSHLGTERSSGIKSRVC